MTDERQKLLQKFLLSKGLIWGGMCKGTANLSGIRCYDVDIKDTNRDVMMEVSIYENNIMLNVVEKFTNLLREPESATTYHFSRDWAKYLIKNLPEERENIYQDIHDAVERISNKLVNDIADLQFRYEMDMDANTKKADKDMAFYEEIIECSKEDIHTTEI